MCHVTVRGRSHVSCDCEGGGVMCHVTVRGESCVM